MTLDPFVARARAAQAMVDGWTVRPWRLGTVDCVRMIASHLRKLGRQVKLPPSGSYRTIAGAKRALRDAGHESVGAALDAMGLERIAPAAAIVGDIIALPAVDELGCFGIALGNGRVLAFHEYARCAAVVQPTDYEAAWRV